MKIIVMRGSNMTFRKGLEAAGALLPCVVVGICAAVALSGSAASGVSAAGQNSDQTSVSESAEPGGESVSGVSSSSASEETAAEETAAEAAAGGGGSVLISNPKAPDHLKDGTYTGSGRGFGGTTVVEVTIQNGKIAAVRVKSHQDTPSFFSKASSLTGRIVQNNGAAGLDAVSGATYSSRGIFEAVTNALSKAGGGSGSSDSGSADAGGSTNAGGSTSGGSSVWNGGSSGGSDNSGSSTQFKTGQFPYPDGVYTGVGEGNGGEIRVAIQIRNQTLAAIGVLDAKDEDEPFLTNAKGVLPTIIEKQTASVDTISGATYSSRGILDAVQDALEQAAKLADQGNNQNGSGGQNGTDNGNNSGGQNGTDNGNNSGGQNGTDNGNNSGGQNGTDNGNTLGDENGSTDQDSTGPYRDGVYTLSTVIDPGQDGDFDAYTLTAELTVTNGNLVSLEKFAGSGSGYIDSDLRYINRAANGTTTRKGVVPQILEKNGTEGVEAVSGATWSANGIIDMTAKFLGTIRR
jgi:uncharacterized protein with FMN-binding domain